jgi:5'-nucleotidase
MKIFVVNDDSIFAEGLKTLVNVLAEKHEIYVAAPRLQQSAKSHALTMSDIISVDEVHVFDHPNVKAQWAISGTPADCVKIGAVKFEDIKFDVLLSGINHGPNLGIDTIYSGTVAAAIDGSFHGIRSIALSLFNEKSEGFKAGALFILEHLETLLESHTWHGGILNINFPGEVPFKGVAITTLGEVIYDNPVQKRMNPRGGEYYWIAGDVRIPENQHGTDVQAVKEGMVSISALKFNFDDPKGTPLSQLEWSI